MENDELLNAYVAEVNALLNRAEQLLIDCEKENATDIDSINSLYRIMHDIKSASIAMNYTTVAKIAHRIEDIISFVKKNELYGANDVNLFNLAFKSIDLLKSKISCIKEGTPLSDNIGNFEEEIALFLMNNYRYRQMDKAKTEAKNTAGKSNSHFTSDAYINVSKDKINMLAQKVAEIKAMQPSFNSAKASEKDLTDKLFKLTDEVDELIHAMKSVPFYVISQKANRIVRDMSKKLGKEVELQVEGDDIEIDSAAAECIASTVTQMVKNSMDHGIEPPKERADLGKNVKGTIKIRAKKDENELTVSIYDDGRGFDEDEILSKAKEKGLLTKPENDYSTTELYAFLMQPGFTTKNKISVYSGRGIGLDIVKSAIEKIGGTITIEGKSNVFSLITLKIPLKP